MFEQITTPRTTPVVTPEQVAAFGRFDVPSTSPLDVDYTLLQLMIEAATDKVEQLAATAMINESLLLTLDFFPGTQDPRNLLNFEMGFSQVWFAWWWLGLWTKDSIELVRRPVYTSTSPMVQPVVTYDDANGVEQTLPSSSYTVRANKIILNIGSTWPLTSRHQDCIRINYEAGYGTTAASVPAQLQLAVMYLATHYYENRGIMSVEPTSEVGQTLSALLVAFRSFRVPR